MSPSFPPEGDDVDTVIFGVPDALVLPSAIQNTSPVVHIRDAVVTEGYIKNRRIPIDSGDSDRKRGFRVPGRLLLLPRPFVRTLSPGPLAAPRRPPYGPSPGSLSESASEAFRAGCPYACISTSCSCMRTDAFPDRHDCNCPTGNCRRDIFRPSLQS